MPPRRDWGKAVVYVSWDNPEAWMNGIVLPRDYELAPNYGAFMSSAPMRLGFAIVVTGPDIPQVEEHVELPVLPVDSTSWRKVVVYPYGHTP